MVGYTEELASIMNLIWLIGASKNENRVFHIMCNCLGSGLHDRNYMHKLKINLWTCPADFQLYETKAGFDYTPWQLIRAQIRAAKSTMDSVCTIWNGVRLYVNISCHGQNLYMFYKLHCFSTFISHVFQGSNCQWKYGHGVAIKQEYKNTIWSDQNVAHQMIG